MKTMPIICLALIAACQAGPDSTHLENDVLHLEAKIPLPGITGRIDHLAYDSAGHRVFVAALGNNSVEVVDLKTGTRVHSITGLHEPQGVLYVPGQSRLVVANGSNGACIFYDGHNYTELVQIDLGDDADNVRFDGKLVYAGYGSGGIAVIDPVAMRKMADLPLKGHPESFRLDDSGRIFINVPDKDEIVTEDSKTRTTQSQWKNNGASANFPMAIDRRGGRLFVGYRHPARLRILDSRTGAVRASAPAVGDADDLFYDDSTGLIFMSGGEGYIDIFRATTHDSPTPARLTQSNPAATANAGQTSLTQSNPALINHIPTRKGARTSLWLTHSRKLILAVPARSGDQAALWIYSLTGSTP